MTNEELVALVQAGDNEALADLVKQNVGLIYQWGVYGSAPGSEAAEELYAAALETVWRAALKFDVARGKRFTTLLVWYLRKSRAMWKRGRKPPVRKVAATAFTDQECLAGEGFDLAATVVDIDRGRRARDLDGLRMRFMVRAAVRLDPREREVLEARMAGETLKEIGARLGVCRERVRQIEDRALRKMRAKEAVKRRKRA